MAVPGEKCEKCQFCGKEITGDLSVFCPTGFKDPSENVCWCVCSECKVEFLKSFGSNSE